MNTRGDIKESSLVWIASISVMVHRMIDPAIAILELLAGRAHASRSELVNATGLSPATVGRAVGRLRRQGVLREVALEASGVGRPPRSV